MNRNTRIHIMLNWIATQELPMRKDDLISIYSYESGLSERAVGEYLKLLVAVKKVKYGRSDAGWGLWITLPEIPHLVSQSPTV